MKERMRGTEEKRRKADKEEGGGDEILPKIWLPLLVLSTPFDITGIEAKGDVSTRDGYLGRRLMP